MLLLADLHVVALWLFLIFWTAEGSCEDIDENDEDHHDPNADIYAEKNDCNILLSESITYFFLLV